MMSDVPDHNINIIKISSLNVSSFIIYCCRGVNLQGTEDIITLDICIVT